MTSAKSNLNNPGFFLIAGLLLHSLNSLAQDKVILMNGNEVEVIVVKVDRDFILSKSTNPADDHVYKYPKTDVVRIEYADGRVEYFDDKPPVEKPGNEEFVDQDEKPPFIAKNEKIKPVRKRERLFYVGFTSGLDLPLGRYGYANGFNHGYAKIGEYFTFETSLLFSSVMGISLSIGYANNQMRSTAVEKKWELPTVNSYTSSVTSYNHTFIFLGPYFSLKTDRNLYVDIKIRPGIAYTPEPYYKFSFRDTSGLTTSIDNRNDSTGTSAKSLSFFTFNAGLALRYNFSKRWGAVLQYDWVLVGMYFNSTQNVRQYDGTKLVNQTVKNKEIYEFASMNNIGLGVYFMILPPRR